MPLQVLQQQLSTLLHSFNGALDEAWCLVAAQMNCFNSEAAFERDS